MYVCVPFTLSRTSALSREAFIKAEINGKWSDLESRETMFDQHKVKHYNCFNCKVIELNIIMGKQTNRHYFNNKLTLILKPNLKSS